MQAYGPEEWKRLKSQLRGSPFAGARVSRLALNAGLRWPFTDAGDTVAKYLEMDFDDLGEAPGLLHKPARLRLLMDLLRQTVSADLGFSSLAVQATGELSTKPRSPDGGTAGLPVRGGGSRLPAEAGSRPEASGNPSLLVLSGNPSLVDSLDLACGDCFRISGAATIEAAARQLAEDGADGLFVDLDEFRARRMSDLLGLLARLDESVHRFFFSYKLPVHFPEIETGGKHCSFIRKPFDLASLHGTLARHLGREGA